MFIWYTTEWTDLTLGPQRPALGIESFPCNPHRFGSSKVELFQSDAHFAAHRAPFGLHSASWESTEWLIRWHIAITKVEHEMLEQVLCGIKCKMTPCLFGDKIIKSISIKFLENESIKWMERHTLTLSLSLYFWALSTWSGCGVVLIGEPGGWRVIVSKLIVFFAFFVVGQHTVCFADFLEFCFCGGFVLWVSIRMPLHRQFAVCFFDLIRGGTLVHAQGLIVILSGHIVDW